MQIDYDPQADAFYIRLKDGDVDDTLEAGRYVFVDVDSAGVPLGLEMLFAGRMISYAELAGEILHKASDVASEGHNP